MNNQVLLQIAQYLDISPSDYKIAQDRFNAVKSWLETGDYNSGYLPDVYLQGSFRLGTVVRPYRADKDGNFDIDQVCELTKFSSHKSSEVLKNDIGDRLKENDDYNRMLDDEGKRCWTIEYASSEGRPGFHIDVLPAFDSENGYQHDIDITHKEDDKYTWSTSNPKGYYYWFKSKNTFSSEFINIQKKEIYESNRNLYQDLEDVPKQLYRTPLQRAIQIMKRHRDVYFAKKGYKPISIIITTISTQVHTNPNIIGIIDEFLEYVISRNDFLIKNGYLEKDGILDYEQDKWSIPNPVDAEKTSEEIENFADKWNLKPELPEAFFNWIYQLKRDFTGFKKSGVSDDLYLRTKTFGTGSKYKSILQAEVEKRLSNGNPFYFNDGQDLLGLIHLGIDGRMDWDSIKSIALTYFNNADDEGQRDIAKVNYYQISRHRGIPFSIDAIKDIKDVLARNIASPSFVMCCNLLLGSETQEMISKCMNESFISNVLEWPIMRLSKHPFCLPKSGWRRKTA